MGNICRLSEPELDPKGKVMSEWNTTHWVLAIALGGSLAAQAWNARTVQNWTHLTTESLQNLEAAVEKSADEDVVGNSANPSQETTKLIKKSNRHYEQILSGIQSIHTRLGELRGSKHLATLETREPQSETKVENENNGALQDIYMQTMKKIAHCENDLSREPSAVKTKGPARAEALQRATIEKLVCKVYAHRAAMAEIVRTYRLSNEDTP